MDRQPFSNLEDERPAGLSTQENAAGSAKIFVRQADNPFRHQRVITPFNDSVYSVHCRAEIFNYPEEWGEGGWFRFVPRSVPLDRKGWPWLVLTRETKRRKRRVSASEALFKRSFRQEEYTRQETTDRRNVSWPFQRSCTAWPARKTRRIIMDNFRNRALSGAVSTDARGTPKLPSLIHSRL